MDLKKPWDCMFNKWDSVKQKTPSIKTLLSGFLHAHILSKVSEYGKVKLLKHQTLHANLTTWPFHYLTLHYSCSVQVCLTFVIYKHQPSVVLWPFLDVLFVLDVAIMDRRTYCKGICILLIHFTLALTSSTHCDARRSMQMLRGPREPISETIKHTKKWKLTKHFNLVSLVLQKETMDPSNANPYVSSPFSLPPYDSLPPMPLPENTPPFCIYPPNTPQTPSTTIPTPIGYTPSEPPPSSSNLPPILPIPGPPTGPGGDVPSPPESIPIPNPPEIVPSPFGYIPSPPETVPGPPTLNPSPPEVVPSPPSIIYSPPYYEPSPPSFVPSPPTYVPSPTGFVPSPTIFHPPIVYPPPAVPPPPYVHPSSALWCVVKPSVPEPIIEEAMNYACGSGADCNSIQPSGACFQPDTINAHASYAFNSYWQRTKVAGGTCSFGGTAILVTVDPSHDGCHFIYV